MSSLTKKVYLVGPRYIPIIQHPRYGKFPVNPDTGEATLPTPYANHLVDVSPNLFTFKKPETKVSNASDYDDLPYKKLQAYAKQRGVKAAGVKREAIIAALVNQDAEAKAPKKKEEKTEEKE